MIDAAALGRILRRAKIGRRLAALLRAVFLAGMCFTIVYPLLTKITMSVMDERDVFDKTVKTIPKHFNFTNFYEVWKLVDFPAVLANNAKLSLLCAALQMFFCVLVGYGFAKFQFRFRGPLFALVILCMVVPPEIIITPLYLNFRNFDPFGLVGMLNGGRGLDLLQGYLPFVLLSVTATAPRNALYIFLARQYYRGLPREINEAAAIDGAGPFRTFVSLMLPSSVPIMVTIFLFAFVYQWNEVLYSSLFFNELTTIPKVLYNFGYYTTYVFSTISVNTNKIAYVGILHSAMTLMGIAPLVVIYAILQKSFIRTIERTGLVD